MSKTVCIPYCKCPGCIYVKITNEGCDCKCEHLKGGHSRNSWLSWHEHMEIVFIDVDNDGGQCVKSCGKYELDWIKILKYKKGDNG